MKTIHIGGQKREVSFDLNGFGEFQQRTGKNVQQFLLELKEAEDSGTTLNLNLVDFSICIYIALKGAAFNRAIESSEVDPNDDKAWETFKPGISLPIVNSWINLNNIDELGSKFGGIFADENQTGEEEEPGELTQVNSTLTT